MYAAVERAIQVSRKLSYIGIAVAVVGACEVSHQDPGIEPEPTNSGVESLAVKQLCRGVDQLLAPVAVVTLVDRLARSPAPPLGRRVRQGWEIGRVVGRQLGMHGAKP